MQHLFVLHNIEFTTNTFMLIQFTSKMLIVKLQAKGDEK
jgi:hypothetical protein